MEIYSQVVSVLCREQVEVSSSTSSVENSGSPVLENNVSMRHVLSCVNVFCVIAHVCFEVLVL